MFVPEASYKFMPLGNGDPISILEWINHHYNLLDSRNGFLVRLGGMDDPCLSVSCVTHKITGDVAGGCLPLGTNERPERALNNANYVLLSINFLFFMLVFQNTQL